MPRVSAFYGIAIYIYYRDHQPPHFHAIYGDQEAAIEIATGAVIAGKLPRRAKSWLKTGWRPTVRRSSRTGTWQRRANP